MDAAIEGYLAWARVERGLSDNTLSNYARDLELLRSWLEGRGVTDPAEDAIDMRRQQTRGAYPDSPAQGWSAGTEAAWREQDPEEESYTWQLGRGLGGRDEEPLDE